MPPDLALLSILIGSNYPCLELIFMVPKVLEPLKLDCIMNAKSSRNEKYVVAIFLSFFQDILRVIRPRGSPKFVAGTLTRSDLDQGMLGKKRNQ